MNEETEDASKLLNSKQSEIYRRLKEIGEEIAAFYLDGIRILNDESIQTKSNLLAHIAREIDGGFRDIFSVDEPPNICKLCKKPIDAISHQKSICNALGVDEEDTFAKEWFETSNQFHRFAHRHGAYRKPRSIDDFQVIWSKYEEVLFKLIGSYYRVLNRFDDLLKKDKPTKHMINALPNLFKIRARQNYFFTNLDKIGWLKPLKDEGFFDPSNNPKPVQSPDGEGYMYPYWNALNYIERIASKSQEENINLIIDVIKEIIDYREKEQRIRNFRTDYQVFKIICALPSEKITKNHIDFIAEALISDFDNNLISSEIGTLLIPKLITDKNKDRLLELLDVVTRFRFNEKSMTDKVISIVKEYWFADIVDKNNQMISTFCGLDLVRLLINRIHEINKADTYSFNVVQIPTIEDHQQHSFPEIYEAVLIRFLRNSLLLLDIKELKPIVKELIEDELIILNRLTFFLINQRYADLHEFLWSIKNNPIEYFECKHELYELFRNHAKEFNSEEITRVIEWIEDIKFSQLKKKEEGKALIRKEWYLALLASEDKKVIENYGKYNQLNPAPIEHVGFITWSETYYGNVSPLQEIELSQMTSKAIAEYLTNFKEQKGFKIPTAIGLAETFTKAVRHDPDKFSKKLGDYKEVKMIYRHALLDGFSQAWKDNKQFDWEKVLKYILNTLEEENKQQENDDTFDYNEWFKAQACRLVEDGTRSDEHAFDEHLLPLAKKILLLINAKLSVRECDSDDFVFFTINSTKGKLLSAMLNYSLRIARVEKKKEWDNDIQRIFFDELSKRSSLELHTLLGQYIQNFLYLNENWIKDNIYLIFPKDKPKYLQAALDGYFFNTIVYNDSYQMLKNAGIYSALLEKWSENSKRIREEIVAQICLAYAEGWESIKAENSLINILLKKNETYAEIINFFAKLKILKAKYKPKLKLLWSTLFDINKETDKSIIGKLTDWLGIFGELDDELYLWSKEGASNIKPYWETYRFIENLTKFAEKEPKKTGDLFWTLIKDAKHVSDYKKDDIIYIVNTLYQKGEKETANKVCNKFGELGVNFLREIYDKNNIII